MPEAIDLSEPPWNAADGPEHRYPGQGPWEQIGPHLAVARTDEGFVLRHPCLSGQRGDGLRSRLINASRVVGWTVVSKVPLTLQPSIHCLGCDLHGWIKEGRWLDCGGGLAWTPEAQVVALNAEDGWAYRYRARVVSVHDGDTLRLDVDLGLDVHVALNVRLVGVQAPEVSGPGVSPEERAAGLAARDFLRAHAPVGADVEIQTHRDRREGRGRYLAQVYADGLDLSLALIEAGHACEYAGMGRAPKWVGVGTWRPGQADSS